MNGWANELRPRTGLQCFLVERVVYSSWQLERANRANSAHLCYKAETCVQDERERVGSEVDALRQQLLCPPFGRPAAHPYAPSGDAQATDATSGDADPGDHPRHLVRRLEASAAGCQWLLTQWNELAALLTDGMTWLAPERFRVYRLLGIDPADALFTTELTSVLRACEVLDPTAGSLVSEIWNPMVSAEALPFIHQMYERASRHSSTPDPETAREYLIGTATRAIDRLTEIAEERAEREDLEAMLAPHRAAVDTSPEGNLLRRYELSCHNAVFHCLGELKKRQAENPAHGETSYHGYYPWLSADRFNELSERDGDSEMEDTDGRTDSRGSDDHEHSAHRVEDSPIGGCELPAISAPALRNEPSSIDEPAADESWSLRNEPSLTEPAVAQEVASPRKELNVSGHPDVRHGSADQPSWEAPDLAATAIARILEDEVSAAGGSKTRRDRGHGSAVTGSRRERRRRKKEQRNARARGR